MMTIHAVSIEPGSMKTVCGKPLGPGMASTGFGRALQDVCPGVNCVDCQASMGLRMAIPPLPDHVLDNLAARAQRDMTYATDQPASTRVPARMIMALISEVQESRRQAGDT